MNPDPTDLLDVRGVDVSLGRLHRATPILHDVSLRVGAGEIVGLIGETGSGKTTLARTILAINRPTDGSVQISGEDVSALRGRSLRAFRRTGAAQYIFQDPLRSLDPDLTARDAVAEGLAIRGELGAAQIAQRVDDALAQVNLDPALADRRPAQLSGGQRQRVAIARALAGEPRLLVCDEPVSALDASSRNQILRLLGELRDRLGLGILVITHDLSSLAAVADRVAVLYRGRIVEDGPAARVLTDPGHPYSGLLVASAPSLGERSADRAIHLHRRVGDPPAPSGAVTCVFADRCPFATERCAAAPAPRELADGWRVACHHADSWRGSPRARPPVTDLPDPRPLAGVAG